MKKHKRLFPTTVMCRVLKISTSGYYDSLRRLPCEQLVRRRSIAQAAAHSYFESNRIYGHRKVHEDLLSEGVICCRETFEDGKKDIFNYIEVFYNRKRRHASLGYVSPVVYEEMHEMKQGRAA